MKPKVENREVRANCGFCTYGGAVSNFMCNCSNTVVAVDYKRSVGYRKCEEFKLNEQKHQHY